MKIRDLVYDLVIEAEISQKRREAIQKDLNILREKWGHKFSPEQIEKYYSWFEMTKPNFNVELPQWRSFLYRFDGNHGYSKFEITDLKQITKYTAEQIKSIYDEYNAVDGEDNNNNEVFSSKDRSPTPEKIEASKNLWYGKDNLIYENDGFRVYSIPNQQVSINYGYYLNTMHQSPYNFGGGQWCTTWHGDNNYYPSKRPDRYFYFIIDESKNPDIIDNKDVSKFYLSALQSMKNGGFKLTDITNPGEPSYSVEDLLKIYPKLSEVIDKLVFVPYDEDTELIIKNVISRINEVPGNKYEYKRVDRNYKLQYIAQGGTIQKGESWKFTDKALRNQYIMSTTERNLNDKFSTYELFLELSEADKNSLSRKIGQLFPGKGISMVIENVMKSEFKVGRTSIDNPDIQLFKSNQTEKFGLFHSKHVGWLNFNGVTYEPLYNRFDTGLWIDDDGNAIVVETYIKGGSPDSTSFYCLYPIGEGEDVDGHFVSYEKFQQLKEKLHPDSGEDFKTISNVSPEDDVDIKEIKKGL